MLKQLALLLLLQLPGRSERAHRNYQGVMRNIYRNLEIERENALPLYVECFLLKKGAQFVKGVQPKVFIHPLRGIIYLFVGFVSLKGKWGEKLAPV